MRKIYLASSWRNENQQHVVKLLRAAGHQVYDFQNPAEGQKGFAWRDCGELAAEDHAKSIGSYLEAVASQTAKIGFAFDKKALDWCDTCVLLLPCGRSAHLEAGYCSGKEKKVFFYLVEDRFEPELMYLLGDGFVTSDYELLQALR